MIISNYVNFAGWKILENLSDSTEATDHAHGPGLAGDPATAPIGGGEGGEGVVVEHRVVGGRLRTLLQDGVQVRKVSLFRIKDA